MDILKFTFVTVTPICQFNSFPVCSFRKGEIRSVNLSCPSDIDPQPPYKNGTDPNEGQPVSLKET